MAFHEKYLSAKANGFTNRPSNINIENINFSFQRDGVRKFNDEFYEQIVDNRIYRFVPKLMNQTVEFGHGNNTRASNSIPIENATPQNASTTPQNTSTTLQNTSTTLQNTNTTPQNSNMAPVKIKTTESMEKISNEATTQKKVKGAETQINIIKETNVEERFSATVMCTKCANLMTIKEFFKHNCNAAND